MNKLFELRIERNLSQQDMATLFHTSQSTYNNWENNKTEPSIEQLKKLSQFFEVSIDYIVCNCTEDGSINIIDSLTAQQKVIAKLLDKMPAKLQQLTISFVQELQEYLK